MCVHPSPALYHYTQVYIRYSALLVQRIIQAKMDSSVVQQLITALQAAQHGLANRNSSGGTTSERSTAATPANAVRNESSNNTPRTPVLVEQSRLFSRHQRNHPYRRRDTHAQRGVGRTLTKTFVCLHQRDQLTVPSTEERMLLFQNKLGESRVVFPANAESAIVKDILFKQFPPLKACGGFEILRLAPNSTKLLKVLRTGSCSVAEMRTFGTGKLYLRPIQLSIPLEIITQQSEKETCLSCGVSVDLDQMREHLQTCRSTEFENYPLYEDEQSDVEDNQNHPPQINTERPDTLPDIEPELDVASDPPPQNNMERPDTLPDIEPELDVASDPPPQNNMERPDSLPHIEPELDVASDPPPQNNMERPDSLPDIEPERDVTLEVYSTRLEGPNTVEECVQLAARDLADVHDPVSILKGYQKIFMCGRQLDITSTDEQPEGKTNDISVSRERPLETAFAELSTCSNFRLPLEITFYGEDAVDLGGPRKEFLELCLKTMIKEEKKMFSEDENGMFKFVSTDLNLHKRNYFSAGLICGLSILQHGPLPCFIAEEDFDEMLSASARPCQIQFREGLNTVGILDLMKIKPGIRFLFRRSARTDLTLRKVKHLLHPKFDEYGSNRRKRQELMYEKFLKYLKEVAAGRRKVPVGTITLGHILQFVTGSALEPVMGYTMSPSLKFYENERSILPTSSTCINCFYLPVPTGNLPENSVFYDALDTAFCDQYFGLQ